MLAHARCNRLGVTPGDERVDEPVGAAVVEIVVGEVQTPETVRVVRKAEVVLEERSAMMMSRVPPSNRSTVSNAPGPKVGTHSDV